MKKFLTVLSIFLMVFMIFFLGCAPNTAYQSSDNFKENGDYLMGFIEFDDQGQLYDRKQLENLLTRLEDEAKKNNLIIVVFAHGWHHNAKDQDDNIKQFKDVLDQITQEEKNNKNNSRKVAGVYLGWRGESINIPLLRYITFWNRKKTAENIGRRGGVTEVLLKLEKIRNTVRVRNKDLNHRLITIGHSFGGLIVYSALSNIILERFISSNSKDKNSKDKIIDGVGDMIVLMNPAFEAIQFSHFYNVISKKEYPDFQPPRMAIFTSKSDLATKYAFPIGRFFSTIFDSYKRDEKEANQTAIGHFEPFKNYEFNKLEDHTQLKASTEKLKGWFNKDTTTFFLDKKTQLKRLDTNKYLNPYLVIQVSEKIMEDHNDIWDNKRIMDLLKELILLSAYDKSLNAYELFQKYKGCDELEQKEMIAKACELEGFKQLLNKNIKGAIKAFQKSYDAWDTYHNVDEILKHLQEGKSKKWNWCDIYNPIINKYYWGMLKQVKTEMELKKDKACAN
jgi:hypothetical protein